MKRVLQEGVNINTPRYGKSTHLYSACNTYRDSKELVKFLSDNSADVNTHFGKSKKENVDDEDKENDDDDEDEFASLSIMEALQYSNFGSFLIK